LEESKKQWNPTNGHIPPGKLDVSRILKCLRWFKGNTMLKKKTELPGNDTENEKTKK
jgi:hypothetical protein